MSVPSASHRQRLHDRSGFGKAGSPTSFRRVPSKYRLGPLGLAWVQCRMRGRPSLPAARREKGKRSEGRFLSCCIERITFSRALLAFNSSNTPYNDHYICNVKFVTIVIIIVIVVTVTVSVIVTVINDNNNSIITMTIIITINNKRRHLHPCPLTQLIVDTERNSLLCISPQFTTFPRMFDTPGEFHWGDPT